MRYVEPVTLKSLWQLMKRAAAQWNQHDAPRLGAALAFYTMWAAAPLLVLFLSIAGLIFGEEAARQQIGAQVQQLTGGPGAAVLQSVLAHAAQPSRSWVAAISGFSMLLVGASAVFSELHDSMNLVWGIPNATGGLWSMVRARFFSFLMVLGVGFLLMASLIASALISAAGRLFPTPAVLLHAANFLASFVLVTVLFALIYKLVPQARVEWGDVWIGAAVTSLLFALGKFLIGLYLGHFSVGSAYGAAGSLVVLIVWVYYSAQIFFLGAEFTYAFAHRHGSHARPRQFRPSQPM